MTAILTIISIFLLSAHLSSEYSLIDFHVIKCSDELRVSGEYLFDVYDEELVETCITTVVVPDDYYATLNVHSNYCRYSKSPFLKHLCSLPEQELELRGGQRFDMVLDQYDIFFLTVSFTKIKHIHCHRSPKPLINSLNKTIKLTSRNSKPCTLKLPENVEIKFVNFEQGESSSDCLPDVLVVSKTEEGFPDYYHQPIYAADLRKEKVKVDTRCSGTELTLRNSHSGDSIYFRVKHLPDYRISDCGQDEESEKPEYICKTAESD